MEVSRRHLHTLTGCQLNMEPASRAPTNPGSRFRLDDSWLRPGRFAGDSCGDFVITLRIRSPDINNTALDRVLRQVGCCTPPQFIHNVGFVKHKGSKLVSAK